MKKVLIVNDPLQYGGSDLVAVRLQQNLNKEEFECVYCIRHDEIIGPMEEQVANTGVRIIHIPEKYTSYLKAYGYFRNLFKNEHFDIVHSHLLFYSGIVLMAARHEGIKVRISHSHFSEPIFYSNSKFKNLLMDLYRKVMRVVVTKNSTTVIGCTKKAGEYLAGKKGFQKKGVILNNGIDATTFAFNESSRTIKRQELGIDNEIVLGHIGQMYKVKNQEFLIDIFKEFHNRYNESVLLLISDGPDKNMLEKKVENLGLSNNVKFLGFRKDIPELLNSMDCMVFPSYHEGFPLTVIEAQASKLPCVISNTITKEVFLSDAISSLEINKNINLWCDEIERMIKLERINFNIDKLLKNFDIVQVTNKLETIYNN